MAAEPAGHPGAPDGGFGTNRIEALADGIVAVAMTLLVLDIKLPNELVAATDRALFDHLLSLEHTFVLYFISFTVLGMFWVGHHAHFHFTRYVDHTLLWLNLLFLFGVTSVPFATDVLGDHFDLHLPFLLYGANLVALAALLLLQIAYLRRHPELAQPSLTRKVARRIALRTLAFAAIPVLSMAVVFYNMRFALYLYLLLPVVHFLPGRVDTAPEPDGGRRPPAPFP